MFNQFYNQQFVADVNQFLSFEHIKLFLIIQELMNNLIIYNCNFMIYSTYKNPYDKNISIIIWCAINFIILTYFIIYAFASAFFQKLLQRPPLWVHIIGFTIMGIDILWGLVDLKLSRIRRNKIDIFAKERMKNNSVKAESAMYTYEMKFTQQKQVYPQPLISQYELQAGKNCQLYPWVMLIINLVVMVLIIIAYCFEKKSLNFKYIYMIVLLRLPQLILFNGILRKILQANWRLFRVYIILKIFYMMLIFAHILGCIFYFVDSHLIQTQYYGSLADNPSYYYQGYLKCYTPIYSLEEQYRYVYAMYYMIALLATVAYGDIIPKNPIQDGMVIFYLYFSTLSIAWILEQMIIVFRRNKTSFYILLRKVIFFDQSLRKKNISSYQSSNYLIRNVWKLQRCQPLLNRLNPHMFDQILRQNKIAKYTNSFFLDYCLKWMQQQYYSEGQIILDNTFSNACYTKNFTISYLLTGKAKQGYSYRMLAQSHSNKKIFGLQEFIVGTPYWKKYRRIITETQCHIFTINSQKLNELFQALYRKKRKLSSALIRQTYQKLNFAGIENAQGVFSIFPNSASEEKMNRTILKFSQTHQLYQFLERKHEFKDKILFGQYVQDKYCSICQSISHIAIECPQCHFIPDIHKIIMRNQKRKPHFYRWNYNGKKIIEKSRKSELQLKRQIQYKMTGNLYERFNNLRQKFQLAESKQQIYKKWNIMKQYNF